MKPWQKKAVLSAVIGTLISVLIFYVFLPPLTPQASGFWIYLAVVIAVYTAPFLFAKTYDSYGNEETVFDFGDAFNEFLRQANGGKKRKKKDPNAKPTGFAVIRKSKSKSLMLAAILLPIALVILLSVFSTPIFNARRYADIVKIQDADFATDMPETTEITHIALMDSDSAAILGNRTLGSLSHVVSQYTINERYLQINYKGKPQKVAPLEYDGFFKWMNNRNTGVPGMVMVDPVNSTASYVEFSSPIKYTESAFFGQDLTRALRFQYPTKIFHHIGFEVDDNGNPFYVVACAKPRILLGAQDISEVILFNPCDGTSNIYPVEQTPSWVDIVYTGDLACEKYNWFGEFAGGFINSIIGNKGCKRTTDDYGYIVREDDVWYFTGVTSVSQDQANIGFILSNARTGEYKYYTVNGAEEHSAMSAAQGEVQEKGYVASFPTLINYAGEATYIMVLKDAAGLVKLYSLVNVENYSIVATGTTQAETMSNYRKLLAQNGISSDTSGTQEKTIVIEEVRLATINGVTYLYLVAEDGNVYRGDLGQSEDLILLRAGDSIKLHCLETEIDRLFTIDSFEPTAP